MNWQNLVCIHFLRLIKSNELNYNEFYLTLPKNENFKIVRNLVKATNDSLLRTSNSILRYTKNSGKEKNLMLFLLV